MSVIKDEFDPQFGIRTKVHDTGDKIVFEKEYDAQPFLDVAAEARAQSQGQRWGDGQHVGFIPAAVYSQWMRQGRMNKETVVQWLKDNPAFVTFDKFLKK